MKEQEGLGKERRGEREKGEGGRIEREGAGSKERGGGEGGE